MMEAPVLDDVVLSEKDFRMLREEIAAGRIAVETYDAVEKQGVE